MIPEAALHHIRMIPCDDAVPIITNGHSGFLGMLHHVNHGHLRICYLIDPDFDLHSIDGAFKQGGRKMPDVPDERGFIVFLPPHEDNEPVIPIPAIDLFVRKEITKHVRYADQYPISAFNPEQSVDKAKISNVPHEEEMIVSGTINEPLPDLPEHLLLGIEPGQHIMGMDIDVLGFLYSSGFTDAFYALDDAGFHFPVW